MLKALIVSAFLCCFPGYSQTIPPQETALTGKAVVVVLHDGSSFKERVVSVLSDSLEAWGCTVVTDRTGQAANYPASAYGTVVFMEEYRAFHVPGPQIRYAEANGAAGNIVFVTTSLSRSATRDNPLDAVTCASRDADIALAARAVLERIQAILK
jgi:hypothetical protein